MASRSATPRVRAIAAAFGRDRAAIELGAVISAEDTEAAVGRSVAHARAFARRSLADEGEAPAIEYEPASTGRKRESVSDGAFSPRVALVDQRVRV